jgi:hypothetical protein
MLLDRAEVALLEAGGLFRTAIEEPVEILPGQAMRVSLYWHALEALNADRTISVRILDADGQLVGQSDHAPAQGRKPTGVWQAGFEMRDVHYITLSPQAQPGRGNLELVIYDSISGEVSMFDDGADSLHLVEIEVVH